MLTVLPHRTLTVRHFAPAIKVKGTTTRGGYTEFTVVGSISAASPNDIARLPEGKRTRQAYVLIVDSELTTADPGQLPDWVQVAGGWYEISGQDSWDNMVMSHYEYLIVKVENPDIAVATS
jgi:hypothetical protein